MKKGTNTAHNCWNQEVPTKLSIPFQEINYLCRTWNPDMWPHLWIYNTVVSVVFFSLTTMHSKFKSLSPVTQLVVDAQPVNCVEVLMTNASSSLWVFGPFIWRLILPRLHLVPCCVSKPVSYTLQHVARDSLGTPQGLHVDFVTLNFCKSETKYNMGNRTPDHGTYD